MLAASPKALSRFDVLSCEFVNRNISEDRNAVRDSATLFLKVPSLLSIAASLDGLITFRHLCQACVKFVEEFKVPLGQKHASLRCSGAGCSDRRCALSASSPAVSLLRKLTLPGPDVLKIDEDRRLLIPACSPVPWPSSALPLLSSSR